MLTLGSNRANSHVHWHLVPLAAGVPYEEQQFGALMLKRAGALRILEEEAELAARIDRRVERIYRLKGQTRNFGGHPFLAFRWISRQYV